MKVFVYFNLHKKTWSVKALEGEKKGLVVAHRDKLVLLMSKFKVSEAGRQRVLKEKRKNVHAGVVGEWFDYVESEFDNLAESFQKITYNPYKAGTFVVRDNNSPVSTANCVVFRGREVVANGIG